MYKVTFYIYNKLNSKVFQSYEEAMLFMHKLPFQSFNEMVKL